MVLNYKLNPRGLTTYRCSDIVVYITREAKMFFVMRHEFQKLRFLLLFCLGCLGLSMLTDFSIYRDQIDFQRALCALLSCLVACRQFAGDDGFFHSRIKILPISAAQRLGGVLCTGLLAILTICCLEYSTNFFDQIAKWTSGSYPILFIFPAVCAYCFKGNPVERILAGSLAFLFTFTFTVVFNGSDGFRSLMHEGEIWRWNLVNYYSQEHFIALIFLCIASYFFAVLWCTYFQKSLEALVVSSITLLLCLIILFAFEERCFELKNHWIYLALCLSQGGILIPLLSCAGRGHEKLRWCFKGFIIGLFSYLFLLLMCWIATTLQGFPGPISYFQRIEEQNQFIAMREHNIYLNFFHPFRRTRQESVECVPISQVPGKIPADRFTFRLNTLKGFFSWSYSMEVFKGKKKLPHKLELTNINGFGTYPYGQDEIFVTTPDWRGAYRGIHRASGEIYFWIPFDSDLETRKTYRPYMAWNPQNDSSRRLTELPEPIDWMAANSIQDELQRCLLKTEGKEQTLVKTCTSKEGHTSSNSYPRFLGNQNEADLYPAKVRKSKEEMVYYTHAPDVISSSHPIPTQEIRLSTFSVSPGSVSTALPISLKMMREKNFIRVKIHGQYEGNSFGQGWILPPVKRIKFTAQRRFYDDYYKKLRLEEVHADPENLLLIVRTGNFSAPAILCFQITKAGEVHLFTWDGIYNQQLAWTGWNHPYHRWDTSTRRIHLKFLEDSTWSWEMKRIPLLSAKINREEL